MNTFGTRIQPLEIRLKREEKILEVDFKDGQCFKFPAEYLRVESPSAEVQGHSPSQKILVAGRRHVAITALEPVGNYAIRIKFDDGHDTGIFTWDLLYEYGQEQDERWQTYIQSIKESGLSRDPK